MGALKKGNKEYEWMGCSISLSGGVEVAHSGFEKRARLVDKYLLEMNRDAKKREHAA